MSPRSDIAGAVELRTRDLDGLTALDGPAAVDAVLRILTELQDVLAGSGSPAAGFHHLYVATTTEVARRLAAGAFEARSFHEWRAGSDQHGVLVLASNAAAWTAGDPAAAWTITVEVRTTER